MATSISNLAFKATLDVAKLAEGGRLGKDAFKALKDAASEAKSDMQKLGDFEALLAKEVAAGTVTQEHYTKAVTAYWNALPAGIKAEKDRKEAIEADAKAVKEAAAEQERYNAILAAEGEKLKPKELRASEDALSAGADYERMLSETKQQAILTARKEDAALAERKHAAMIAEGDGIMRRHKPAVQEYREQVEHLNALLKAGAIDQRAHSREIAGARGSLVSKAAGLSDIPIVGDVASRFASAGAAHPALGALAAGAFVAKGALEGFLAEAEKIDAIGKNAEKVGISTEAYLTFSEAAKYADVSMERVANGIAKMNRAIGEAAEGGKTQQAAMQRLGLDYRQLATMKPEDAFLKISDALRNVSDPYARATIQQDIFGKSAAEITRIIRMGSGAFGEIKDKLDAQGRLFSAEDAERVDNAADAYQRLGTSWLALKQNLTIAAAGPLDKFFTNAGKLLDVSEYKGRTWIDTFNKIGNQANRAVLHATGASFFMGDGTPLEKKTKDMPGGIENVEEKKAAEKASADKAKADEQEAKAVATINEQLELQKKLLQDVLTGKAANSEQARVMDQAAKAGNETLGTEIVNLMNLKKRQEDDAKAKQDAEAKTKQLATEVENFTSGLRSQAETFGMSSRQTQLYAMRAKGATDEQLADAKRLGDALDAMEEKKKKRAELETFANQVNEQSATSQDRYREQVAKLNAAFQARLIDPAKYYDALTEAKKKLREEGKKEETAQDKKSPSGVDAAMQGSSEAMDRIEAFRSMMTGESQKQADAEAAKREIETKAAERQQAIAGLSAGRQQWETNQQRQQLDTLAGTTGAYSADMGLSMPGQDKKDETLTRLASVLERLERGKVVVTEAAL